MSKEPGAVQALEIIPWRVKLVAAGRMSVKKRRSDVYRAVPVPLAYLDAHSEVRRSLIPIEQGR